MSETISNGRFERLQDLDSFLAKSHTGYMSLVIKNWHGTFIKPDFGREKIVYSDEPFEWSIKRTPLNDVHGFTIFAQGNNKTLHWRADRDANGLIGLSEHCSYWEVFSFVRSAFDGNKFGVKSVETKCYVCAEPSEKIIADRGQQKEWETLDFFVPAGTQQRTDFSSVRMPVPEFQPAPFQQPVQHSPVSTQFQAPIQSAPIPQVQQSASFVTPSNETRPPVQEVKPAQSLNQQQAPVSKNIGNYRKLEGLNSLDYHPVPTQDYAVAVFKNSHGSYIKANFDRKFFEYGPEPYEWKIKRCVVNGVVGFNIFVVKRDEALFWSVDINSNKAVVLSERFSSDAVFQIEVSPNDSSKFSIRSNAINNYVCAEVGGKIVADRNEAREFESFEFFRPMSSETKNAMDFKDWQLVDPVSSAPI